MEPGINETNTTNSSVKYADIISAYSLNQEDSNWIISNSFIIFTMQTGFGMLESGCVSLKNEVNIMMKNVVDIVLGGLTYWAFGFAMSFGSNEHYNPFIGLGEFLIDPSVHDEHMGPKCAAFLFQLSFATTSTTIVSGAMAERCNFKAYCLFSFLNTIVYCVPAGWVWGDHGFLKVMGAVDIAGSGVVHLVGGSSALACAIMLGPRLGRYDNGIDPLPLGNPVNAIMGLFVLWWGWLAFNSGSTYGVSEQRWQYAARAAVCTMLASMGGGLIGLGFSLTNTNGIDILSQINGILGSLVAVTGGCFLFRAWESIIVGMVGAFITCFLMPVLDKVHIDDPVGASATHGASGIWGIIAIGLFADNPYPLNTTNGRKGLLKGGGWYLLGVQCLTALCLGFWSFSTSIALLWGVNKLIPIRMSVHDELLGADLVEHRIRHMQIGVSRAMSALRPISQEHKLGAIHPVGINPGHDSYIDKYTRKSRLKMGKRLSLRNKSSKTPQSNGITDATLTKQNKPHIAWMD
ncbi:PREDICTED: putative ammonium transporter 3 [Dufourea novaeangliae]|uniref:Ammonium transporter n=1 Tax=Dufourea novaeangliae TaxID=178035 RepID=A0A154P1X9_DUFNO|nr:PREDICTED: putative ammonium transporter 3 [Dufourea novaeangliae]KZC05832.1 Putative ammonium transporter 3 [Dufourea novaeangliae]